MMRSTAARESGATAAAPPSARHVLVMHTAVAMARVRRSLARAIGWPESRMTAHTSSAPRTALARVASMAAPHTLGSMTASAASSAWKIVAARAPPSQNSATLKATLTGDWPRLTTSTTIGPSRMPSSIAHGSAKMRPKTSGSSLSEKMWTLRRNSTCTTHSSATAKAPASSHHAGRGCGPSACRWRTCMRVSARALAPIAAIRPQTRGWPPGRRRRPRPRGACVLRGLEPGAGTAQPSPQEEPPQEEPPQEEPPQEEPPQDEPPQDEPPQDDRPHAEPPHGAPPPSPPPPGGAPPGRAAPRGAAPRGAAPLARAPARAVGADGPDVGLVALRQPDDQLGDEGADRGGPERPDPRRGGGGGLERLDRRGGVGAGRGDRAHDVEPTRTLGIGPRSGQRVGGGLDDRLDLVGREVGPALEQQRDGARDDGGGLRRAAALEQVVARACLGVREVEGRVRVAQAGDRAARRDEVGVAAQAAARPRRDDVGGHGGGAGQGGGADGEDEGVVAG